MPTRRGPSAASRSKAVRGSQARASASDSDPFTATCLALAAELGVEEVSQGSLDYFEVLGEAAELHIRKVAGYGKPDDAWANFRRVADVGLDPVVGVVVRMNDKMSRINNLVRTQGAADMIDEGLERELADMLGYSGIGISMSREAARGED